MQRKQVHIVPSGPLPSVTCCPCGRVTGEGAAFHPRKQERPHWCADRRKRAKATLSATWYAALTPCLQPGGGFYYVARPHEVIGALDRSAVGQKPGPIFQDEILRLWEWFARAFPERVLRDNLARAVHMDAGRQTGTLCAARLPVRARTPLGERRLRADHCFRHGPLRVRPVHGRNP